MPTTPPSPFLRLPLELREQIYSLYFKPSDRLHTSPALEAQGLFGGVYRFEFDLWRTSRQIYEESSRVWRRENVFVKIATPWPSAGMYRVYLMGETGWGEDEDEVHHISTEGLVPIVCTSPAAELFKTHTATVQITAPFHHAVPEHTAVLLLDDLHLFAQTWYYSALSYPMLNDRLSTTFRLVIPSPPHLQRRLLLPFGNIKGMSSMHTTGYLSAITTELEARMKTPLPTLSQTLETATHHLETGDQHLAANNPTDALSSYTAAFHAIHILIHAPSRTRRILADAFFHAVIPSGRYAGQTGMTVRIVLRLKLMARYVHAHLCLGRYDDAAFWGMRSIRILRDALDTQFEAFLTDVVGAPDVGFIHLRTAVAMCKMAADQETGPWDHVLREYKAEGESSDRLFTVARRYLRNGLAEVRRELEGWGMGEDVVASFADESEQGSVAVNPDEDGVAYQDL